MARNLQAKLPPSDTIRVYDINAASMQRFVDETKALSSGAAVEVAGNVREAAEDSVSSPQSYYCVCFFALLPLCDEFVLSMI
jgi:3-hydroxyisobutyrate dehydrogenase